MSNMEKWLKLVGDSIKPHDIRYRRTVIIVGRNYRDVWLNAFVVKCGSHYGVFSLDDENRLYKEIDVEDVRQTGPTVKIENVLYAGGKNGKSRASAASGVQT